MIVFDVAGTTWLGRFGAEKNHDNGWDTQSRLNLGSNVKWQDELRNGHYCKPSRMSWEAFRDFYSLNALPALSARSQESYETALNVFEKRCTPQKLADVTTARITGFVTALRSDGKSESSVACYLRHLKAAMRWAHKQGLLSTLPTSPCRSE
jgi:hypothetical protein